VSSYHKKAKEYRRKSEELELGGKISKTAERIPEGFDNANDAKLSLKPGGSPKPASLDTEELIKPIIAYKLAELVGKLVKERGRHYYPISPSEYANKIVEDSYGKEVLALISGIVKTPTDGSGLLIPVTALYAHSEMMNRLPTADEIKEVTEKFYTTQYKK
jgi:hypothetical protein